MLLYDEHEDRREHTHGELAGEQRQEQLADQARERTTLRDAPIQREEGEVENKENDHGAEHDQPEDDAWRQFLTVYAGYVDRQSANHPPSREGGNPVYHETGQPIGWRQTPRGRTQDCRGDATCQGRSRSEQAHGQHHHAQ